MATILPPNADANRRSTARAAQDVERRAQSSPTPEQLPHVEPTPREIMAEAMAIYPDTSPEAPTPEEIAAEAYAIYLGRGSEDGHDLDDWLQAEKLLRRTQSSSSSISKR